MRRVAFCALFAAAAVADAPKPPSTEDAMVTNLATAKFAPATTPGLPAGVMNALIGVDPKTGGTTGYGRIPAGATIPTHWHSHAEYTVLISGQATFTIDGKSSDIAPGAYTIIPAKAHHQLSCAAGAECVVLTRRAGPTDYNFVK